MFHTPKSRQKDRKFRTEYSGGKNVSLSQMFKNSFSFCLKFEVFVIIYQYELRFN
jgi:hypothetical protein